MQTHINSTGQQAADSLLKLSPTPHQHHLPLPCPAYPGGRVSDSFDRRILTTYLEEYLGDFLFDAFQPFHLYSGRTPADNIDVPPGGPKDVYTRAIEGLPLVQTPEVGSRGRWGRGMA